VDKHSENSKVRKTILKFISIFHPDKQTEVDEELPHLFGPESQRKEVLQIYEKLSKLLSLYGLTVSALQLRDNQAWEVLLSNGILLRLGNRDLESRLKRFCRAYPAVFADKPEQLTSVDLRYARGMAVQWKQQMGR
jgi:cell division protein FtsQ